MAPAAPKNASHRWSFYRAGGVDQVRLDKGADILNLDQLDQKLWVALSCPVKGLEIDERTLQLLDSDGDAHVRPPEIIAAVKWLREVLQNADGLALGEDGVKLGNLRKDTAEGKALLAAVEERLWDELYGLGRGASPLIFDDQYMTTGGQIYEIMVGHDRMLGDLRPLAHRKLGYPSALVCHPYDICTAMLLQEAGGVVETPWGEPLRALLDTTSPVSWMGYANAALAEQVRPILQRLIREHL
jgi:hypothetical protein